MLLDFNIVQSGDLFYRPTEFGIKEHFGTGLSNGLIENVMPGQPKLMSTLEQFGTGLPVQRVRFDRTPEEKAEVERRALANADALYSLFSNNCETDTNFAQFGIPISPTAQKVTWGLVAVGAFLACVTLSKVH